MSTSLKLFIDILSHFDDGHKETIKSSNSKISFDHACMLLGERLLSGFNSRTISDPELLDCQITPLGSLKLQEFRHAAAKNSRKDKWLSSLFTLLLFVLSSVFLAAIDIAKQRLSTGIEPPKKSPDAK